MLNPNQIIQILQPAFIFKIGLVIILSIFALFLLVINRQISLLNKIISENFYGSLLQFLALGLFVATAFLIILAVVLL